MYVATCRVYHPAKLAAGVCGEIRLLMDTLAIHNTSLMSWEPDSFEITIDESFNRRLDPILGLWSSHHLGKNL